VSGGEERGGKKIMNSGRLRLERERGKEEGSREGESDGSKNRLAKKLAKKI